MPIFEFKSPELTRVLSLMAARALQDVALRAFSPGVRAQNVRNQPVPALSTKYLRYKSATQRYPSDTIADRAKAIRRSSGLPGPGPMVNFEGVKRRLGARFPEADQRLSDQTAKALGIVRQSNEEVVLGFRDRRSRVVASALQERNDFFGLTEEEVENLNEIANREADKVVRSVKVKDGVIRLDLFT